MEKKISLLGGASTGIGMIIATSCFISLADGASQIGNLFVFSIIGVCIINMLAAASIAELNAMMPNLTGGIAQYTLVGMGPFITIVTMVGGYLISNIFAAPAEGAMFANVCLDFAGDTLPPAVYSVGLTIVLIIINIRGVNMSTFVQTIVASIMVVSLFALGIIGAFGLGTGTQVEQPAFLSNNITDVITLSPIAFWLFIGFEFIVPLGKDMEHPKRNVPLAMFLSLGTMCIIQVLMVIGFSRYTLWDEVGAADSPHILYAVNMLGDVGRYWIIVIALLAAVSTQNSIIGSVSEICCGMAKIGLLPSVFQKKNKYNAPYVAILLLGGITILIEATGISSGDAVQFLILTSSIFIMLSYLVSHINVIVLRKKWSKVPRNFKVPFYPLPQIIGIVAMAYMILNISTDVQERMQIFLLAILLLALLTIYAIVWIKRVLHLPFFKSVEIKEVMAMENPMYYAVRHPKKQTEHSTAS